MTDLLCSSLCCRCSCSRNIICCSFWIESILATTLSHFAFLVPLIFWSVKILRNMTLYLDMLSNLVRFLVEVKLLEQLITVSASCFSYFVWILANHGLNCTSIDSMILFQYVFDIAYKSISLCLYKAMCHSNKRSFEMLDSIIQIMYWFSLSFCLRQPSSYKWNL